MCAALCFFLHNKNVEKEAQRSVESIVPKVASVIAAAQADDTTTDGYTVWAVEEHILKTKELVEVEIDGHGYVGVISFPALSLELPVMADWNDEKLSISPCRFSGNVASEDLVIMAHNYTKHFGKIGTLAEGAEVLFTDMEGKTTRYEVVVLDVLAATDVEDMTAGEYDLTLFTCNYSGKSRVTLRCDKVQ